MKVEVQEPGKWDRVLTVEVPAEEVAPELESVYRALNSRMTFPGFRRGKAPRRVIKAHYGRAIETEVLEKVVPRCYRRALAEHSLFALSDPEFDRIEYAENEPLSFQARVKVGPRITPEGYGDLKLKLVVDGVRDAEVDTNLESLRERHANFVPVEREAVTGDLVVVDTLPLREDGSPDGEWRDGLPLFTGGEVAVFPEFEAAVVGARAGDEREAAIGVPPARQGDEPPPQGRFRLRVREVREKMLPAIDDELARRIETGDGPETRRFADLAELRAEIARRLELAHELRGRQRMGEEAVEALLQSHPFEAPDFLVDQLLEEVEARDQDVDPMIVGDKEEKTRRLRAELRPEAERRVKRSLLLNAVGGAEGVRVTAEDEAREVARLARREGVPVRELRERLERSDSLGGLRERIMEAKVLQWILDHAQIEREGPGVLVVPGKPGEE